MREPKQEFEPYEELDPETRDRAVFVLLDWAARQKDRHKPFLELIDGSTLAPQDLLDEPPPLYGVRPHARPAWILQRRGVLPNLRLLLRILLRRTKPRAWTHVLNLIAVSAFRGDDDVEVLLDEIAGRTETEGLAW